ncbi:MAG: hypothetical protein AAF645_14835 [Myxococcota bacterium]
MNGRRLESEAAYHDRFFVTANHGEGLPAQTLLVRTCFRRGGLRSGGIGPQGLALRLGPTLTLRFPILLARQGQLAIGFRALHGELVLALLFDGLNGQGGPAGDVVFAEGVQERQVVMQDEDAEGTGRLFGEERADVDGVFRQEPAAF